MLEIDPVANKRIRWRYRAQDNFLVQFDYFTLEQQNMEEKEFLDNMEEVPGMAPVTSNSSEGIIEWNHAMKGLLVLRWRNDNEEAITVFFGHDYRKKSTSAQ